MLTTLSFALKKVCFENTKSNAWEFNRFFPIKQIEKP